MKAEYTYKYNASGQSEKKLAYMDLELADIKNIYCTENIPYFYSASGYGKKIPTRYIIRTIDNRLHRVYTICYSNIGSAYIRYKNIDMVMVESAMLDYNIAKNTYYDNEYPVLSRIIS